MCETSMEGNRKGKRREGKGTDGNEGPAGCDGRSSVLVSLQ